MANEEVKVERTADDLLKQMEAMEKPSAQPVEEKVVEQKPEVAEKTGDQPAVVEEKIVAAPVEKQEPTPVVEEGKDQGKKLTKEEKADHAFAEMRKKIADLEKQIEDSKASQVETPKPERVVEQRATQPVEPKISVDEVLDIYSRAKNGELTDEEIQMVGSADTAIQLCEKVLNEKIGADELYEARQRASASLNARKSDMVEVATKYLPVAQQRERMTVGRVQAEVEQNRQAFTTELNKVKTEFPEMTKPDTEIGKYVNEWDKDHLSVFNEKGEVVKQGKLTPVLSRYLIAHPYEHATMIKSYYDQVSKANGITSELKKKVALNQSPESGTPPVGENKKTRTADDLLREMEAMATSSGRKSAY